MDIPSKENNMQSTVVVEIMGSSKNRNTLGLPEPEI